MKTMKTIPVAALLLLALLQSRVEADEIKTDEVGGVLLYTHSGHYRMSPAPVLHSDLHRILVENVEKLQGPSNKVFTKITYKPLYGKIETKSHEFRKQHETQSITILLLGDHVSKLKTGDILRMCYYPN